MRSAEQAAGQSELEEVYLFFRQMAERFTLAEPAAEALQPPANQAPASDGLRAGVTRLDDLIQAYHLRLFLQTGRLCSEATLRNLIGYYRQKQVRSGSDRDKLDFLLVQYLAQCAPAELLQHAPLFSEVSEVLKPVLGEIPRELPPWLEQAEDNLRRVGECKTMRELLRREVLDELRKLKAASKEAYFGSGELAAFARVNLVVRQTFFRLIQKEVEAICRLVQQLESGGISTVDCRRAGLSSQETPAHVLELAQRWKRPFQAEYSAGHPFSRLVELREALENSLPYNQNSTAEESKAIANGLEAPNPARALPGAQPTNGTPSHLTNPGVAGAEADDPPDILSEMLAILKTVAGTDAEPECGSQTEILHPSGPALVPLTTAFSSGRLPETGNSLLRLQGLPSQAPAMAPPRTERELVAARFEQEFQAIMQQLSSSPFGNQTRAPAQGVTVVMGETKLALSSWEVAAVVESTGELSYALQRGVAARVLLLRELERARRGDSPAGLSALLPLAREATRLVQRALARPPAHAEAKVALSTTAQYLASLLSRTERFLKTQSSRSSASHSPQ